ncbi:MAG: DUF1214 domain-containing protein [Parvibaculum sp.]|nr:DUF1214 domain-containing protein [Parvibaculum sp.]
MKNILFWLGVVVAGTVLGLGATALTLRGASVSGNVSVGPWNTNLTVGGVDADATTRARVALFGLLALDKKETIYYTAGTDSAGEKLSGSCTYVLKGRDLAARWWSVTAYDRDSFLIPNEANIFSFSKPSVQREADNSYVVRISADKQPGNWLPVKAGESFDMTARFYNPEPEVYTAPEKAELPTITKESCQ